jgi:membrane-anchored mycosin MYCP
VRRLEAREGLSTGCRRANHGGTNRAVRVNERGDRVHRVLVVTTVLALALLSAPPAVAIAPPSIDPGAVPRDETGPEQPLEQRRVCKAPLTLPGSNFHDPPWTNTYLGVTEAQKFATGAGVTVAVIDTGVAPSPRVPAEPGGDFVAKGDGLTDCDAHGTLTASIIAGRPSASDGFIGVAPAARLISLRQTSEAFEPKDTQNNQNDPNATPAAGSVRSLARAVVHAANLGAAVINVSEAACFKVRAHVDESTLGAALNYAVNVKGAVVIVAAGNTGGDCAQNPPPDPGIPSDPRGWQQVQTVVTPAWYAPLVLTVGGVGENGAPSTFSMHGPWVGAAAPAENVTALGDNGEPVDALPGKDGPISIAGTSFAAAFVSGLAALLRQRFPDLTPAQIINRITATARHPGGGVDDAVGAGVVDPVAALTWDITPGPTTAPFTVKGIQPPAPVPAPDHGPITAVAVGVMGLILALGLTALTVQALRRR